MSPVETYVRRKYKEGWDMVVNGEEVPVDVAVAHIESVRHQYPSFGIPPVEFTRSGNR